MHYIFPLSPEKTIVQNNNKKILHGFKKKSQPRSDVRHPRHTTIYLADINSKKRQDIKFFIFILKSLQYFNDNVPCFCGIYDGVPWKSEL